MSADLRTFGGAASRLDVPAMIAPSHAQGVGVVSIRSPFMRTVAR